MPLAERVVAMRQPARRQAILESMPDRGPGAMLGGKLIYRFDLMFALGDPPNYEPSPEESIAARATAAGVTGAEMAYDVLTAGDGTNFLYLPTLNWANGTLDAVGEQLAHPASIPGLSDGGAHVGTICDVSFPTTLLQWWGRDRPKGRLPLELLVHKQCRATAVALGLEDRGLIAPGHKADVNVIDFDGLRLRAPEMAFDLPAGGKRLLQRAEGYLHTIVSGQEIMANGQPTGATPGGLVRGAQAPA